VRQVEVLVNPMAGVGKGMLKWLKVELQLENG
jgi:hypothetical protein